MIGRPASRRLVGRCVALTVLALYPAGCFTGERDGTGEVVRDTLPSGVERVQGPPEGVWSPDTTWTLRERMRLGSADEDGPELFGNVWDVELGPMGRVYVLDRLAKEVRVFDSDGAFVRSLGREGEGPGEFVNPFGLAWGPEGHLWIVDVRLARYSVFDTAGAHLREYRRTVGGFSWPWPGRFDDSGRLLEASLTGMGDALMAFRPDQEELVQSDSLPRALLMPEVGDFWNLQDEQGIGAVVGVPFGRRTEWALAGDGTLWMGTTGTYALARRDLRGDTLFVIERSAEPVEVSDAERAQEVEALGDYVDHPKMDLSRIPEAKPFFRRLIPDDDGNLWVLREGSGDRWFLDVFRDDGAYLGAVDLPLAPSLYPPPLIREGAIVVVTRDELDVQYVVVYDLVSSEASVTP